jgi:hypothetical protein
MDNLSSEIAAPARRRFVLGTSLLLFISFASLYLFSPPSLALQPWDSLNYAYSTEVNGIRAIEGNHPLGHLVFDVIFLLVRQLGYAGRALKVFQIVNGILGGLIVAAFFAILVFIINIKPIYAFGFSVLLGASYSFWFFAGTGDIYHISTLSLLLVWASLAYGLTVKNIWLPIVSGMLTGFSILFHQLNVILIPVGLAFIVLTPDAGGSARMIKVKRSLAFVGSACVVATLGYLWLGFIATSSFSLTHIVGWMRGYFGDPTYGRYLSTEYLSTAWNTVSQMVLFSPWNKVEMISSWLSAFLLLVTPIGLLTNHALDENERVILKASAIECLITWPFVLWWEPQNPKFWLLTLCPCIILVSLSLKALETRIRNLTSTLGSQLGRAVSLLPLILGMAVLAINLFYNYNGQDSPTFQDAMNVWLTNSGPNDVLITAGDFVPQLLYWGGRPNTVYLYRVLQASQTSTDSFSDLRKEMDQALCAGHAVLITPAASEYVPDNQLSWVGLSRENLRAFLYDNAHKGKIAFWYRDLFDNQLLPVYILTQSGAC